MPPKKAVGKALQKVKKVVETVKHKPFLETWVGAQQATAAPPLGTELAERQVNVAQWIKEFNERTVDFESGLPIPTRTFINPSEKSYRMVLSHPPCSMLIKKAAGIQRGAMEASDGEVAAIISLKHVYHIAELKREDDDMDKFSLKEICDQVVQQCCKAGVKVVPKLTAEEIAEMQALRKPIIEEQLRMVEERRASKFLRAGVEVEKKGKQR